VIPRQPIAVHDVRVELSRREWRLVPRVAPDVVVPTRLTAVHGNETGSGTSSKEVRGSGEEVLPIEQAGMTGKGPAGLRKRWWTMRQRWSSGREPS